MSGLIKISVSQLGMLVRTTDLCKYFTQTEINRLKRELTVVYEQRLGRKTFTKESYLYRRIASENSEWFAVARFCDIGSILQRYKPELRIKYVCCIVWANGSASDSDRWQSVLELSDYQQICHDYLIETVFNEQNLKLGMASCVFVMDTGLGKTYQIMGLLEHFRRKTLIILPASGGLADWIKAIGQSFPYLRLGQYHSKEKTDGDIVIMLAKSALKSQFQVRGQILDQYVYFREFDVVVFDEVHDMAAETNQNILWQLNRPVTIGITATPSERADRMDIVYHKHLGKQIRACDVPGFGVTPIEWRGEVDVIRYEGPPEYTTHETNNLGWTDAGAIVKNLDKDPYRNQLITDLIIQTHKKNLFVFIEHRSMLEALERKLQKSGMPCIHTDTDNTGVMKYMGGSTPEDKEKAEAVADVILTTYSFSKQSLSIKKMTNMILANPRRSKMRQILGRIFRAGSDASIVRHITDIVDTGTALKSQFKDRLKIYEEKGFVVNYRTVKYTDITLEPDNESNHKKSGSGIRTNGEQSSMERHPENSGTPSVQRSAKGNNG